MRETSPEKHGEFRIINLSVKLYPPLEMSSNLIWTDNKRRSSDQTIDGEDLQAHFLLLNDRGTEFQFGACHVQSGSRLELSSLPMLSFQRV